MPKNENSVKAQTEPFPTLLVFDQLDIGPIKLEKNRLVAPYTLTIDGVSDSIDFIYKFDEHVFTPDEAESLNLASMMAAQVALNYGLFCRRIVFHGLYNQEDKKFIHSMMDNTSREIYVKKFLEDNPFILRDKVETPIQKLKKYTQATIQFVDHALEPSLKWSMWSSDKQKHAVLSSGGKDSLLSFGLLDEIGKEVFSYFVNESGRHWFTALNAFHYFKENIPNTARVWTNSDRVFSWMVRRMPFIRKDFASIRSDDYPIRLWTVAVFLFGVLPLLRKHGIGRLIIGDEYDTTVRPRFNGIPHYDGLYDQSRYFDNALSRYFMKKGWGVTQFSLVRPLSELLIEKVLVERYPHLQAHQTSCHAAHKEGERIRPCGVCEKCRRIIAMLKAIDADPQVCGYSEEQIEKALAVLPNKGVHQEKEGAQQLYAMLQQKNLAFQQENTLSQHPEILHLRIDSERSPLHSIPVDLRQPIYHILLQHTEGAMRRVNRMWNKIDLFRDPDMTAPYPFELAETKDRPAQPDRTFLWGELTWPDAQQRFKEVDVAILPVGAIEQHGPHLPLDTDAFDADYLARKVAEACSRPRPFVLPLVPYGVSYHHEDFAGTISLTNDTLARMVYDIGMSAARNGIQKLLIINGHGGNDPTLNYAAQTINRDSHIFVAVDTGETSDIDIDGMAETHNDVHAGEIETSTTLAIRPHLVKMELAKNNVPEFSSRYLNFSSKRGVSWHAYTNKITDNGVMGDPTKATVEKGEKMWQVMIEHLVALVEDLKSMTLEELYQRRY
jgi:creatinine amidohydrolase/Fe(II)-dependent formamide hydrolase-like protein